KRRTLTKEVGARKPKGVGARRRKKVSGRAIPSPVREGQQQGGGCDQCRAQGLRERTMKLTGGRQAISPRDQMPLLMKLLTVAVLSIAMLMPAARGANATDEYEGCRTRTKARQRAAAGRGAGFSAMRGRSAHRRRDHHVPLGRDRRRRHGAPAGRKRMGYL